MRLALVLTVALAAFAIAPVASARGVHKCTKPSGAVYYTDKACSAKNTRDRKPVVHEDTGAPAPPPPKKPSKR